MTWWTGDGDVVPPKPVIDLLVEAAASLRGEIADEIELDDPGLQPETGVSAFDDLDPKTRVLAIAHVLLHLSDPGVPSPDLFAWNEGTLWALFRRVMDEITSEIDMEPSPESEVSKYRFRRLVLDAVASYGHPVKRNSQRSRDRRCWDDHLEMIHSNLFWDLDCLDEDEFGDMEPRGSEWLKDVLGIDPDLLFDPAAARA